jgi:hypothetical protein
VRDRDRECCRRVVERPREREQERRRERERERRRRLEGERPWDRERPGRWCDVRDQSRDRERAAAARSRVAMRANKSWTWLASVAG